MHVICEVHVLRHLLLRLEGVGVAIATEEWAGFFRRADTMKHPPQPQVTSCRSMHRSTQGGTEGQEEGDLKSVYHSVFLALTTYAFALPNGLLSHTPFRP